jgi:Tol biopolymer transport system component
MAFYSRRSDTEGLSGLDLSGNFAPNDRFQRYTGAVEDARESPPRWNPTGSQLVFSSTDSGDNKSRLYLVAADYDPSTKRDLGLGEDPVWSPDGSTILYRNTGETGNTPGLVLYSMATNTNQRLTNAEDRRPLWLPDGNSIIFMRRLDERNWELFRLFLDTGELVQLTNNPAQDGLPALSPGGKTIVFASDRTGGWQLWTIGLDESELGNDEARLLMPIQGTFLQWLEHSIQWVN